jgi:site-specific DNA-methyltransferase (adenine-specific)
MGGGTTGEACVNTGRNFIGIESDPRWFGDSRRRIGHALPFSLEATA